MNETRQSLLFRAQSGEADAWKDLMDVYRPLIIGWLNRQGVPAGDLDDLTQEVLLTELTTSNHLTLTGPVSPCGSVIFLTGSHQVFRPPPFSSIGWMKGRRFKTPSWRVA